MNLVWLRVMVISWVKKFEFCPILGTRLRIRLFRRILPFLGFDSRLGEISFLIAKSFSLTWNSHFRVQVKKFHLIRLSWFWEHLYFYLAGTNGTVQHEVRDIDMEAGTFLQIAKFIITIAYNFCFLPNPITITVVKTTTEIELAGMRIAATKGLSAPVTAKPIPIAL